MDELYKNIKGVNKILNFFGEWPSFHDAEVLNLELDREIPSLQLKVSAFIVSKKLTKEGNYKLETTAIIIFRFLFIENLNLHGFNNQNAIFDMTFQKNKNGDIKIDVSSSYGLEGEFNCKGIEVVSVVANSGDT